jgi:hypothetical protein
VVVWVGSEAEVTLPMLCDVLALLSLLLLLQLLLLLLRGHQ